MVEVISVKFKNRGKCYFFEPNGLNIKTGDRVIVDTSKGLEIADCSYGNHGVPDSAVVPPLRPVVRLATKDDLRVAEINKQREKEAFDICQQKIEEHDLDMKLVDVECNFEGNKTMFFFTSEGRVDFRELVKDLAGIFRNRIELRQIGVRDEAKMLGGIGICGRPYCCNQFLDDFQPVSTKMAKVQSLSLNPTKISGSCGRLMCCLRYEQEAYEELIKNVPKQGAFVETKDGYGSVVQVNLLRQTVKVKLDEDGDDALRTFKSNELAAVPGGRPKDGERPPHVFQYVPEEEEEVETVADEWIVSNEEQEAAIAEPQPVSDKKRQDNRRRRHSSGRGKPGQTSEPKQAAVKGESEDKPKAERPNEQGSGRRRNGSHGKAVVKPVKVEPKQQSVQTPANQQGEGHPKSNAAKKNNRRRRYYHGKPKSGGEG